MVDPLDQLEEVRDLNQLTTMFDSSEVARQYEDGGLLWYQEAAVRMAKFGEAGLHALLQRLNDPDEDKASALLLGFCFLDKQALERNQAKIRDVLLASLHDNRPLVAAQAISSLRSLGFSDSINDIMPFLSHKSPYVVGSALRFLSRHNPAIAIPILRDALKSSTPVVRETAIDELHEMGDTDSLTEIRNLMADANPRVREAACTAVRDLEEELKQT